MTDTSTHDSRGGNPASLLVLRLAAVLTGIGGLVQAGLGGSMLTGDHHLLEVHSIAAIVTMAVAIIAGVAAGLWSRQGGNTGLMWHALSVAVMAVLQYGLGEMGLKLPHAAIGVAFLVAAIALATLAYRKPYAADPHGPLNESTHHHSA